MPIDQALVVTGVALLSSAVGVLLGARSERRRLLRRFTDDAQTWLHQRTP